MADQNPPASNDATNQQQQGSTVTIDPQAGRVPLDANAGQVGRNVENANLPASPNPATLAAPGLAPSPGLSPGHYKGGKITRQGMEHVIRGGGSVLHNGRIIAQAQDLPSEVDLAGTDAAALDNAEADLDRREQSLATERARLATARRQQQTAAPAPQQAADAPPKDGKPKGGK